MIVKVSLIFFDQNITTKEAQAKLQKVAKVMLMEA